MNLNMKLKLGEIKNIYILRNEYIKIGYIETLESEEAAIKKIEDDWKFKGNYLTKVSDKSVYVCNLYKLCISISRIDEF